MRDDTGAAIPEFIVVAIGIMILLPMCSSLLPMFSVHVRLRNLPCAKRRASTPAIFLGKRRVGPGRPPRSLSLIVISISRRNR